MLEHILVFTNIFVSIICLHMYLLCFSPYVLLSLPRYFVLYFYVATFSVIGRTLWLTLFNPLHDNGYFLLPLNDNNISCF